MLGWLAGVGTELLDCARLRPDSYVLDIASGTGEPALSGAARCPQGKVMMTDLSANMLLVTTESAARRGLRNIETRQCDAGALPFADNTFDAPGGSYGAPRGGDGAGLGEESLHGGSIVDLGDDASAATTAGSV